MTDPIKKPFNAEAFELVEGVWTLRYKTKIHEHTCAVLYCGNDPYRNELMCTRCRSRQARARNPIKYAYYCLKHRAKQRGHVFTLTVEQFAKVVAPDGKLIERGRTAESLSVDRIQDELGYVEGNLRLVTVSDNIRRRFVEYVE